MDLWSSLAKSTDSYLIAEVKMSLFCSEMADNLETAGTVSNLKSV